MLDTDMLVKEVMLWAVKLRFIHEVSIELMIITRQLLVLASGLMLITRQHAGRLDSTALDKWCEGASVDASFGAVAKVLGVFRTACHHGDPQADSSTKDAKIMSDALFQKVLVFTLREADHFFRRLLKVTGKEQLAQSDFQTPRSDSLTLAKRC
jgi:hypothetical protein